jgi:hypothetical protein
MALLRKKSPQAARPTSTRAIKIWIGTIKLPAIADPFSAFNIYKHQQLQQILKIITISLYMIPYLSSITLINFPCNES